MNPRFELSRKIKTKWRDRRSGLWTFFCPLCRAERKSRGRPGPQARHFLQIGLCALVFTILTWRWFGAKGLVSFVPIWTVFEIVYRSRVRAKLTCEQCGFDPYLYLVDVQRARAEVDAHWRRKFEAAGIPYPERKEADPARR